MAPSSPSSGSESDVGFDADMEALRRACMITGTDPAHVGSDSDGDSSGSDDFGLLRRLRERFSVPEADDVAGLQPLSCMPPPSPDEEDDFEILRAIQRRFAQYNDDSLKKKSTETLEEAEIMFHDGFYGPATPNIEPNKDQTLALIGDEGGNLVGNFLPSILPKSGQNFVDALKKNRSCQKFIRRKMIEIEAKIEKVKELKERMKCLMDFQVSGRRRLGNALGQKMDPCIRLISVEERRTEGGSKTCSKKGPSCFGPAENSHVSKYRMVLEAFPVSLTKQPWSKLEKENLSKGLKQQYQETMILNSINCSGDAEELTDSTSMSLLPNSDLEVPPEKLRSFMPSVDWDRLTSMYLVGRSGAECEARWLNCEDPMINYSPWTAMEDKKLLLIVQERGMYDWIDISVALGTYRTPFQCLARYQRSLNPHILNKSWTEEEDQKLRAAVENYGDNNWQIVASCLEGRSNYQCSNRWKNTLNPKREKVGRWSVDEDKRLKVAVMLFGAKNWKKIAKFIPGRTQSQCRERWHNCLNPSLNLKPWTAEEDAKLLAAIAEHGHCWSKVANCIPPRTDSQCRRRWKILLPEEVPLAQAATQLKKTVLVSNFVSRKRERPAIGPNDFTSLMLPDMQGNVAKRRKKRISDNIEKGPITESIEPQQDSVAESMIDSYLAIEQTETEKICKSRKKKSSSGNSLKKSRCKQKGTATDLSMDNVSNSADFESHQKMDEELHQCGNAATKSRHLVNTNSNVHNMDYTSNVEANENLPLIAYLNSKSSDGMAIKKKNKSRHGNVATKSRQLVNMDYTSNGEANESLPLIAYLNSKSSDEMAIKKRKRSNNLGNKVIGPSKETIISDAMFNFPAEAISTDCSFLHDMNTRDAGRDMIERAPESLSDVGTRRTSRAAERYSTLALAGNVHPQLDTDLCTNSSSNNLRYSSEKTNPVQTESIGHVTTGFTMTDRFAKSDHKAGFSTLTSKNNSCDEVFKGNDIRHQLEREVNVMQNCSLSTEGVRVTSSVHCSRNEAKFKSNSTSILDDDDDDSLATFYKKAKSRAKKFAKSQKKQNSIPAG